MELLTVKQIGIARTDEHRFWIELNPEYREAMTGLKGFEYLNIFWWFDRCDNSESRSVLTEEQPYSKGPAPEPHCAYLRAGNVSADGKRDHRPCLFRRAGSKPDSGHQALYTQPGPRGAPGRSGLVRSLAQKCGNQRGV